jgi:hypothetical protein
VGTTRSSTSTDFVVVEIGHQHAGNGAAQEAFDGRDVFLLFRTHQREGVAQGMEPPRAADPVDIVLGGVRHVVVDDV